MLLQDERERGKGGRECVFFSCHWQDRLETKTEQLERKLGKKTKINKKGERKLLERS